MNKKNNTTFNRMISSLLFFFVMSSSFIQYFKIFNVPLFYYPLVFLILYSLIINKFNKISKMNLFIIFWIIYAIILTLLRLNFESFKTLILLSVNLMGIYVVIKYCIKNFEYLKYCIKGLKFGLFINLIVALWEIATSTHIKELPIEYERRFFDVPVTFYPNANDLSTVLVSIMFIVIIDMVYYRKNKFYDILNWILLLVTYFVIIKTRSSLGILSIPVILTLTYWLKLSNRRKVLLFPFLISLIILFSNIIGEIILGYSESIISRFPLWISAIILLFKSWGIGIGPGQNLVLGKGNVHMIFLEILSEYGIIIGITIMYFYFKTIYKSLKIHNSKHKYWLTSFLLFLIVLSASSSTLMKLPTVWIVFAIIYVVIIKNYNESHDVK